MFSVAHENGVVGNYVCPFARVAAGVFRDCVQMTGKLEVTVADSDSRDYFRLAGLSVPNAVSRQMRCRARYRCAYTFRHTYRSQLDVTGAPVGVQQKLMRHAQVATTMDVYGNALMDSKRDSHSKVVGLLLRAPKDSQS